MAIPVNLENETVRLVGLDAYDDSVMVKVKVKQVLRAVTCVTEIAYLWGKNRKHVQRMCEVGAFSCELIGGQYIVITQSVIAKWGNPTIGLGAYRNE